MRFRSLRDVEKRYKALSFDEQTECEILVAKQRYEMPMGGAKGKIARIAFLVFSLILLLFVGCFAAGIEPPFWIVLGYLRCCGFILLVCTVLSLVIPSLQITWRMIWGSRFPVAAVLSLIVSAVLVSAAVWGIANFAMLFEVVIGFPYDDGYGASQIAVWGTVFLVCVLDLFLVHSVGECLDKLEVIQCHEMKGE